MRIVLPMTFLVAGLAFSTSAIGSDWQLVSQSEKAIYSMDFQSLAPVGAYRKAWILITHIEAQDTYGYPKKTYHSEKLLYYFDCSAKMLEVAQRVRYSDASGRGAVVETLSLKFDPKQFDDVVPDSIGETLNRVACGSPTARARIKAENDAVEAAFRKVTEKMKTE